MLLDWKFGSITSLFFVFLLRKIYLFGGVFYFCFCALIVGLLFYWKIANLTLLLASFIASALWNPKRCGAVVSFSG